MDITTKINFYGSKTHVNGRYVNLTGQNVTITDKGSLMANRLRNLTTVSCPSLKLR